MVEDGNVTLETPITDLIPGFSPQGYDTSDPVTLGTLASQISGLVREDPLPCKEDYSECNYTTGELLPHLNQQHVLFGPNKRPTPKFSKLQPDTLFDELSFSQ